MAILYGTAVPAISKHIKNIFESGELQTNSTISKMEIVQQEGDRTVCRTMTMYNMDMIIAVGYRVNSIQATNFRIWATQVLKEYLYRGYAIYQRMNQVETKWQNSQIRSKRLCKKRFRQNKGFSLMDKLFDAYQFVSNLIRSAKSSIVLIDNYADDSVLTQLTKRADGVIATICVSRLTKAFRLDVERHNMQYSPVQLHVLSSVHDRFLLLDDSVLYTFGASFKDLGKKLFCFTMIESADVVEVVRRLGAG